MSIKLIAVTSSGYPAPIVPFRITTNSWRIFRCISEKSPKANLLSDIGNLQKIDLSKARNLFAVMGIKCQSGQPLGSMYDGDLYHKAHTFTYESGSGVTVQADIWRIRQGYLRLYIIYISHKRIVCLHLFYKRTDKLTETETSALTSLAKKSYFKKKVKMKHQTDIENSGIFEESFDFSDIDATFIKKHQVASEFLSLISHENIQRKALAEKLGWSEARLSRVLSGEQNLTIKTITSLSVALDYDFSIYFHKSNDYKECQPWETNSDLIRSYEWVENSVQLEMKVQCKEDVAIDFMMGEASDVYISLSIPKKTDMKFSLAHQVHIFRTKKMSMRTYSIP